MTAPPEAPATKHPYRAPIWRVALRYLVSVAVFVALSWLWETYVSQDNFDVSTSFKRGALSMGIAWTLLYFWYRRDRR